MKIIMLIICICLASSATARQKLPLAYITLDGIHATDSGVIFAASGFDGNKVYAVSTEGVTTDYAQGLEGPIDITDDAQGNLYVTNLNGNKVSKISADGIVSDFAITNPGPAGIVSDPQGNIYVSHYGIGNGDGDSILKITPEGHVSTFSQGDYLQAPIGITIDEHGNIYTANFNNGMIIKIAPDGVQSHLATIESSVGYAVGHLTYVNGRLFATGLANQKVYIVRVRNGRVRERNIVDEGEFPNGITFNRATSEVLFTNTFAPASDFTKIRVRSKSH